jgi:ATPase family AAA domain-containing protein 3A/B
MKQPTNSMSQAGEYRTTVLNGIREFGRVTGDGLRDYLSDRSRIATSLGILGGGFLSFYLAKNGTKFGFKQLESRLGKPPLVRDTSRNTVLRHFRSPLKLVKSLFAATNPMKVC